MKLSLEQFEVQNMYQTFELNRQSVVKYLVHWWNRYGKMIGFIFDHKFVVYSILNAQCEVQNLKWALEGMKTWLGKLFLSKKYLCFPFHKKKEIPKTKQ